MALSDGHSRLASLDGVRGYATMLVFLTHAFGLALARTSGLPDVERVFAFDTSDPVIAAFAFLFHSNYGVDLFFVLSGLLMTDIAIRRWPGTRRFLARRALRIYPPYLLAMIAAAVVVAFMGQRFSAGETGANLALLQGFFPLGIRAINPITWSLSYEAAFYLAVPAIAVAWGAMRHRPVEYSYAGLAILFAAITAVCAALTVDRGIYLAYFTLFIPGIALGLLGDAKRNEVARRLPVIWVVAAWVIFALAIKAGILRNTQPVYYAASAVACGLVVLKACDAGSGFGGPVMSTLGRYSYSFFLVHYVIVHAWGAFLAAHLHNPGRLTYAALLVVGALAISLVAARVLYELTERWYFARRAKAAEPGEASPLPAQRASP